MKGEREEALQADNVAFVCFFKFSSTSSVFDWLISELCVLYFKGLFFSFATLCILCDVEEDIE